MYVGVAAGAQAGVEISKSIGAFGLGTGIILGAMIVGAAFLVGMAVLKRSAAAICGFVLLAFAMAVQAIWLGLVPAPGENLMLLLLGLLAASALIFLSSTIAMVGRNQLLGGLVFAAALSMAGIGVINAILAGEASGLLKTGLGAVAATAIGLSALAGMRGDVAAKLILPGAALAGLAPLLLGVIGAGSPLALVPHALFAVGVLTASLVALGEFGSSQSAVFTRSDAAAGSFAGGPDEVSPRTAYSAEQALRVSENQLAEVLDFAGVAVWDWNRQGSHQTGSFAARLGADCDGAFSPEMLKDFIHTSDARRFETHVCGSTEGDGGFDETIKLHNGKLVRMRGARAVDNNGALERIVVFLETASASTANTGVGSDALKRAAASLTSAAAAAASMSSAASAEGAPSDGAEKKAWPAATFAPSRSEEPAPTLSEEIAAALDRSELAAAFQPVVCLETGKACGAESLLRWPKAASQASKAAPTEEIVRLAQEAGKGRALATFMLTATANQIAEKIAAGETEFFGAFNVSLSQVREDGFIDDVKKAISDRKLPKGALVLELTEAERLNDTPKINDLFKKLRAAGAALAYDDFGAGYSSLSNLHRYDFDYLKIDKSFIDDIVANGGKKKIVAALARLGRDFNMTVIAEGVETKEAAEVAKTIGCKMGQGYYLGAPSIFEAEVTIENPVAQSDREPEARAAADDQPADGAPEQDGDVLVLGHTDKAPRRSRLFRRRPFSVAGR
ncbi:MAG: EAL domain-containing protein [Parvularculaceae bacterium]|nr:EAL domain-containing protein [Parvularculaceae bacterium]